MSKNDTLDKIANINRIFSILTIIMWVSLILGVMVLTWFLPVFPNGNYTGKADAFLFLAVSNRPVLFIVTASIFIIIFIICLLLRKRIKKKYREFML